MINKNYLTEIISLSNLDSDMTEKQLNILISAIELFSEKGYEATATSEIAKKGKVAEGTIFRYYKTKKDLLFAIPTLLSKSSVFEIFLDDFNEIWNTKHETFESFLRKLVLNRKNFVYKARPILKVIIQELPFHPELRNKILNTVIIPSVDKFIKILDRLKEQGEILDLPTVSIINLIASSLFGYFFLNYIAIPEINHAEQDLEFLIKYIMNGVSPN